MVGRGRWIVSCVCSCGGAVESEWKGGVFLYGRESLIKDF
jgi:hypothetical protein